MKIVAKTVDFLLYNLLQRHSKARKILQIFAIMSNPLKRCWLNILEIYSNKRLRKRNADATLNVKIICRLIYYCPVVSLESLFLSSFSTFQISLNSIFVIASNMIYKNIFKYIINISDRVKLLFSYMCGYWNITEQKHDIATFLFWQK